MITFTHATWISEETGMPVEVYVDPNLVFSVFYMPENKATAIVSTGGGHVIVREETESVSNKIANSKTKGVSNGE